MAQCPVREREMFYLTTHSTPFIYGYMVSDIWLRTILIVRKETRCRHIGYSYRLTARVLLCAPSHRQDNTYHGLCYTSHGALAGTRNCSPVSKASDFSDYGLANNYKNTKLYITEWPVNFQIYCLILAGKILNNSRTSAI